MTLIVVIIFGFGVVLIASALDNTPLIQTFQKVLSGQPVDWTGQKNTAATVPTSVGGTPSTPEPGTPRVTGA